MKIAISAEDNNVNGLIDQRFGRCKYFAIADSEDSEKIEFIENKGAVQGHGAGIRAAQQICDQDVKVVITGRIGPNATAVLDKLGIKAYHASGPLKEAIAGFADSKLEEISDAAAPHSGLNQEKESHGERIFFPLLDDKGEDSEISPHFGHAPFFGVYDVGKKELKITRNDLDHTNPDKSPIDQIKEAVNPTTIFAKGIGGRAIGLIAQSGMSLKTGNYSTVREVIENLDKLQDQTESCGH